MKGVIADGNLSRENSQFYVFDAKDRVVILRDTYAYSRDWRTGALR